MIEPQMECRLNTDEASANFSEKRRLNLLEPNRRNRRTENPCFICVHPWQNNVFSN
jgi:hypothetical protein